MLNIATLILAVFQDSIPMTMVTLKLCRVYYSLALNNRLSYHQLLHTLYIFRRSNEVIKDLSVSVKVYGSMTFFCGYNLSVIDLVHDKFALNNDNHAIVLTIYFSAKLYEHSFVISQYFCHHRI